MVGSDGLNVKVKSVLWYIRQIDRQHTGNATKIGHSDRLSGWLCGERVGGWL